MSTLEQSLKTLEDNLESRYKGLVLWTSFLSGGDEYHAPIVRIMTIQIPSENRKQGLGSEVMSQIISWADDHGVMLSLSPSTDFGASSVSRLTKFYRRFGFKPNKGRNKDFRTRDTMLRNPSLRKNSSRKDTSYKMPRKWGKEHCESKSCGQMGFSEKASCRPYVDCYGGKKGSISSHMRSRVASRYLRSAKRDDPKLKNTGHGGLSTWFAGHGGGKPDDRATWGDWIAITPIKHTVEKEDGESKTYESGDIVGPCAISSEPSWRSVTDGGKNPLKCMPRDKAHDLTKEQRATLARKKRREEAKSEGQKPVHTPTFSEEGKDMIKDKSAMLERTSARPIRIDKRSLREITDRAWSKIMDRAEIAKDKGESFISQAYRVKVFEVGELDIGSEKVFVAVEIDRDRPGGASYIPSYGGIYIRVKDYPSSLTNPVMRELTKVEARFKREFLSLLEHEVTHAHDKIRYDKNLKGTKMNSSTRSDFKKYVNSPPEIKAFLQQIASDSESYLRKKYGLSRESIRDHFIESLIQQDHTYKKINPVLTPKNRKYIKSAVLTYLLDEVT